VPDGKKGQKAAVGEKAYPPRLQGQTAPKKKEKEAAGGEKKEKIKRNTAC